MYNEPIVQHAHVLATWSEYRGPFSARERRRGLVYISLLLGPHRVKSLAENSADEGLVVDVAVPVRGCIRG